MMLQSTTKFVCSSACEQSLIYQVHIRSAHGSMMGYPGDPRRRGLARASDAPLLLAERLRRPGVTEFRARVGRHEVRAEGARRAAPAPQKKALKQGAEQLTGLRKVDVRAAK